MNARENYPTYRQRNASMSYLWKVRTRQKAKERKNIIEYTNEYRMVEVYYPFDWVLGHKLSDSDRKNTSIVMNKTIDFRSQEK